jgi:predicted phosphoadenosine phosphosulfate sulfurtransferase
MGNLQEIPILFSGGVDSLMVAHTINSIYPNSSILLFNVAFGDTDEAQYQLHIWYLLVAFFFKQCSEAFDRLHSIEAYKFLKTASIEKYGN